VINLEYEFNLKLKVRKLDIETGELIAVLNDEDAHELGVLPLERIIIKNPTTSERVTAVVDISDNFIKPGEIGLYTDVNKELSINGTKTVIVSRSPKPESIIYVKEKMDNKTLDYYKIKKIVEDVKYNNLSKIELTGFMSAVYINGLNIDEAYYMAKALVESGKTLNLKKSMIVDKHSIGGINGRATMIIVPIVASMGLCMPKTSSRSITSAAGTADSMEVLADVNLGLDELKEVVEKVNAAIIWGGSVDLAPVDDKMIKIEHPLSLDPPGQVVASVLSKKKVVGATNVVIDLPVGPELKVKNLAEAEKLANSFIQVGNRLGMNIKALITNGSVPSGPAFGPALEAREVLQILEGKKFNNLAEKSCELAGKLFESSGKSSPGEGVKLAKEILREGKALKKMKEIINAQGKRIDQSRDVVFGEYTKEIIAGGQGYIHDMSIKTLSNIAKRSGAPYDKGAGLMLNVDTNDSIEKDTVLFTIYSNNKSKLNDAYEFALKYKPISLESVVIKEMD
jgi:AMP phosphorylase